MRQSRGDDADDDVDEEWDEDEGDFTKPCPKCGELIVEDADYCPACDQWLTSEEPSSRRKPWWIVATILILLAMFILSAIRF
jgi:uncharacterized paraquat-inducible protein A